MSLNKVETVIKLMPIVDNCCLIAHPSKSYCICLITPNLKKSQEFLEVNRPNGVSNKEAASKKTETDENQEAINELVRVMDTNPTLRENFNKELAAHCLKQGLERFEIPTKTKFVKEIWLPDSGLVTDSLKLKRREIEKYYEKEIKSIYV